jgi:rhodanese-related sulfurtransferase
MTQSSLRAMPARLDVATLREWLDAGDHESRDVPRVLDVRTTAEFRTVHIPGSYNVPLDLLREHRGELSAHLAQDVVLVCRSGARAGQAETLLADTGLPNVHVLDGGLLAWQGTDAPVTRGAPRWDLERQVRLVAGALVLAGVLASILVPTMKWLSAAIGGGLAVAAFTDSCVMGLLLSKLPYNRDASCDLQTVLAELTDTTHD